MLLFFTLLTSAIIGLFLNINWIIMYNISLFIFLYIFTLPKSGYENYSIGFNGFVPGVMNVAVALLAHFSVLNYSQIIEVTGPIFK